MKINQEILVGKSYAGLCEFYSHIKMYSLELAKTLKNDNFELYGLILDLTDNYLITKYFYILDNELFMLTNKSDTETKQIIELGIPQLTTKSDTIQEILKSNIVLDLDFYIKNN